MAELADGFVALPGGAGDPGGTVRGLDLGPARPARQAVRIAGRRWLLRPAHRLSGPTGRDRVRPFRASGDARRLRHPRDPPRRVRGLPATGSREVGSGVRALSLREQPIAQGATVRPLEPGDAPAMHRLITANRAHLDRWLRWSSAVRTPVDVEALIARFQTRLAAGDGFHCGIRLDGALAGGVVCWYINRDSRNAEVGYWLAASHTGWGLATAAARSGRAAAVRGRRAAPGRDAVRCRQRAQPRGRRAPGLPAGGDPARIALDHRPVRGSRRLRPARVGVAARSTRGGLSDRNVFFGRSPWTRQ